MLVLIIGLGSMGKRRYRLLKEIDESIEIYCVETNDERAAAVASKFHTVCFTDLEPAMNSNYKYDAVFVCTSPLSHHGIIDELLKYDVDIFTELNLISDGYDRYIDVKDRSLFLSSTFLYRKDIRWMIDKVSGSKVNYIYHTGQYLPDWHPWEDYRKYFVGNKQSNGCREIMAIEFPWLIEAFSDVKDIVVKKGSLSSLEVDYPDNYMISVEHENGSKGMIAVDVVSRCPMRKLEIYNEDMQILWGGRPDTLKCLDMETHEFSDVKVYDDVQHQEGYSSNIIENAYRAEIEAFFECKKGNRDVALYSFEKDKRVLELIDEIEK